jgi:hypothetical protein
MAIPAKTLPIGGGSEFSRLQIRLLCFFQEITKCVH